MEIRKDFLEFGAFYHIYSRGINSCDVFLSDDNKFFFLQKAKFYLSDFVEFYAFCLMSNHYNFVVKVKEKEEIVTSLSSQKLQKLETTFEGKQKGIHAMYSLVSKQFGKLISSYTQAFNKQHKRHGSLFETPFKRKRIASEDYLQKCIIYVHRNPLDINESFEKYPFLSYKSILSNKPTAVKRAEVLQYFGDRENFVFSHQKEVEI